MNKKRTLVGITLAALSITAIGLTANIRELPLLAGNPLPTNLDCSYYFNSNNGYTTIRDLNKKILGSQSTTDYKTWGTITNKYVSSNKTCYYVQSTDQYGEKGGILIYNAATTTLDVGNVVTIRGGTPQIYSNGAQLTGATLTLDYTTNPSPVELLELSSYDFVSSNIADVTERGPLFVSATNALITSVSSNQANIQLSDGTPVVAFFGSSTATSAIRAKFNNLNGSRTNIKGHLGRYNSTMQLYVRDADYVGAGEVFLSYILTEKNNDTPYAVNEVPQIQDFTVTAYYSDGSHRVVTGAEIYYYNTGTVGSGTVSFSYTEGNTTKYDSVSVDVQDDDYQTLEINYLYNNWDNVYFLNQDFQVGTVIARNVNTYQRDVVELDTTNFTTENYGHFTKTLSYTTRFGNLLTIDYEYYVAPVSYIDVPLNVVQVKQGEEFIPAKLCYIVFDVSGISELNRNTYLYSVADWADVDPYFEATGFDTNVLGEQTIYINWHGYHAQFNINVYKENQYIEPRGVNKTQFEMYEEFVMPTMYYVDLALGIEEDVTSKCQHGIFYNSWFGEGNITIWYEDDERGYFSYTFKYEIIEHVDVPVITSIYVGSSKTNYKLGDTFEKPEVFAQWSNGDTTLLDSNDVSFTTFDNTKLGKQTITASYQGFYSTYEIFVTSNGTNSAYEVNTNTLKVDKNYATGNYGTYNQFGYYRVARSGSYFNLLPYSEISNGSVDIDSRNGALYNVSPFNDIETVIITYSTVGTGSVNPTFSYGEQNYDGIAKETLEFSSSSKTVTFDLSDKNANYFKLDGGDVKLSLQSLYIEYSGENTPNGSSFIYDDSYTNYRINPTVFSGTLEDGISSVTVPVEADIDGDRYHVTDVKTYTYYTLSYAADHTSDIDRIAMTDPVDVANYYTVFNEFPANYCYSNDWSSTYAVFGDKTRCVSEYSRTDGYARSVPYASNPSTGKPLYYEFDIALDSSYSSSSRGVGRVVAWKYGFNATGYDNSTVCTFTDDHYATFIEFNNLGGWNKRFDAQQTFTLAQWKNSINLIQF